MIPILLSRCSITTLSLPCSLFFDLIQRTESRTSANDQSSRAAKATAPAPTAAPATITEPAAPVAGVGEGAAGVSLLSEPVASPSAGTVVAHAGTAIVVTGEITAVVNGRAETVLAPVKATTGLASGSRAPASMFAEPGFRTLWAL